MSGRRDVLDRVPGLRALALSQDLVVRRSQLRDLGVTRLHVGSQVAAGRWRCIGPHVVVLTTGALSRRQQMYVGLLHAGRDSALAGWTALELDGLQGWSRPGVHVVGAHGSRTPPLPGLTMHQTRHLDDVDIAAGRPRRVTPARAAIDAAGWLRSERAASGLVLAVAQQRLATPAQMLDVLGRIWRVCHTAVLRGVLESAAGLDSHAELDVDRIARRVGFRDVRRQVLVDTPLGPVRADLAIDLADGRTLLVEVDGPSHDDPTSRARDTERDAALLALGYQVLRIPVTMLRTDPERVESLFRSFWMRERGVQRTLTHPERASGSGWEDSDGMSRQPF